MKESPAAQLERTVIEADSDLIRRLVRKAQYKKALKVAKKIAEKHPENRFAQYHLAVMLGDCNEGVSKRSAANNAKKAAKVLKGLLRRTNGISFKTLGNWKNEYYWFSNQPHKQFKLGENEVKLGWRSGYYSMGVGGAMKSLALVEKSRSQSLRWAKKSISAWENYFKVVPDYYNAYVWYAKALGLSGDIKAMEKALKKASKLSGRPLSYQEFAGTRKEVMAALAKAEKNNKPKRK